MMKGDHYVGGLGRSIVEEFPSSMKLSELYNDYGRPILHHRTWNLSHLDEEFSPPSCSGEVIIIMPDGDKIAYVARRGRPTDWFFPMGRIGVEESVEEAAIREAYEETGLSVDILAVPLLYVIDITFKDWDLIRWHFVVIARPNDHTPRPVDEEEIEKVAFFKGIPHNSDPFLKGWAEDILNQV